MEIMHTDKAPAAVGPYSQAVKTGNLLFCSGQIGLNPATGEMVGTTVAEQAKQVMENVKALLENAGATFDNVVKTTCFIADMKEFGNFNEVYAQYFSNNKAALRTLSRLPVSLLTWEILPSLTKYMRNTL